MHLLYRDEDLRRSEKPLTRPGYICTLLLCVTRAGRQQQKASMVLKTALEMNQLDRNVRILLVGESKCMVARWLHG